MPEELTRPQAGPSLDAIQAAAAVLTEQARSGAESRLRSSRLWTTVGGVVALAGGQFAGLPPVTQVCITVLAGVYIVARTIQGGR